MKYALQFIALSMLVSQLVSCDDPLTHLQRQREARAGLDAALAALPKTPEFDTVKVVYSEFYDDEHGNGPVCYYARGYVILGSNLADSEALANYATRLQVLGWSAEGIQYQTQKVLIQGKNARILIYSGDPGVDIRDAMDYTKLRNTYRGVIFVMLTYMIPQRDGC